MERRAGSDCQAVFIVHSLHIKLNNHTLQFIEEKIRSAFIFLKDCIGYSGDFVIDGWLYCVSIIVSAIIFACIAFYVERLCMVRCCLFHLRHVVHVQSVHTKAA